MGQIAWKGILGEGRLRCRSRLGLKAITIEVPLARCHPTDRDRSATAELRRQRRPSVGGCVAFTRKRSELQLVSDMLSLL